MMQLRVGLAGAAMQRSVVAVLTVFTALVMPLRASADTPAPPSGEIFGVFAPIPESFVLSDDPFAPGAPSGPLTDSTKSQWCLGATPEFAPSVPDQIYKSFQRSPSGTTNPIYADEYDPNIVLPPPTPQGWPALILLQGGEFEHGCRQQISGVAHQLSVDDPNGKDPAHYVTTHFIVFSIDTRLACDPAQVPDTSPIRYLCGWTFKTPDTYTPGPWQGQNMAAIHDVMDAVHWVSTGWPNLLHVPWNGQVFAAGASSGGNVVAMAATQTAPDATYHPRAVAMWSGVPEFDRVSNITDFPVEDDYVCNLTSENAGCWTHVNNYLGCYQGGVPPPTVENGCTDVPTGNGRYQKASPNYYYSQNPGTSSPVFFANGGDRGLGQRIPNTSA